MTTHPQPGDGSPAHPVPLRILPSSRDEPACEATVSPQSILADLTAELVASRGGLDSQVCVTLDVPEDLWLEADSRLVRRLLAPLLRRGVDAARRQPPSGRSRPEVLVTGIRYPDRIELEFADSGAGMTPRERNTLPHRGSTTSPAQESTDSVLDDVLRLAVSLGGTVSALDCPEGGSAVTLHLPIRRVALRHAA